jgi:hypothetical protein
MRGGRVHPVIVGAGVSFLRVTHQGQAFHACDVRRIGAMQVAAGVGLLVQLDQRTGLQHLLHQGVVLRLRAVAPVHLVRACKRGNFLDPCTECFQLARHYHAPSQSAPKTD